MNIHFKAENCRNLHFLQHREWLETNGRGGYASSTLLNCHTRKYHGLLVANLGAPAHGRHVLLSKFEESVHGAGVDAQFTSTQFPGALVPVPPPPLIDFELTEYPTWTFAVAGACLRRSVVMSQGRDTVLLRFTLDDEAAPLILRLRPFLAYRRFHDLMRENGAVSAAVQGCAGGFQVTPYAGMPSLFFQAAQPMRWTPAGAWYRDFEYLEERDRGYPFREDLFVPALIELELMPGAELLLSAGTAPVEDLAELWVDEVDRRRKERRCALDLAHDLAPGPEEVAVTERLILAGGQLLIHTPDNRPACLAGYHWFEDWGRDTMIALPGVAFHAGRLDAGFEVLETFAAREQRGFLPNYINPDGSASYNSVDASLWFFWSVQHYLLAGGDLKRVRARLWPVMRRILEGYAAGSADPVLRMDADGLLAAGTPETQLTWMDACIDGCPVTPRWGYAVEVNALWYNALCFCSELAKSFCDKTWRPPAAPAAVARAFRQKFWLADAGYLADVVNDQGVDRSLRPNQVFAVSLPHSPLTRPQQEAVMEKVTKYLATAFGLRTLRPGTAGYREHYAGDGRERDVAYHQGTVWPWLMGAFTEAYLRVHRNSKPARELIRLLLHIWRDHLTAAGVGSVSEVVDAEMPFRPNGCIAQAWSIGEVLRSFVLLGQADRKGAAWHGGKA